MIFKEKFLYSYLKETPTPLAIERSFECEIYSKLIFDRPILDIGCGDGIFAHILFGEKIDVGIDPNYKEILSAAKMNVYSTLHCCRGNEIPYSDRYFQTIFSNSVLEHIEDIQPVISEIYRLLDNTGSLYITVPTEFFEKYSFIYRFLYSVRLKKSANKFALFYNKFWQHYNVYSVTQWSELFEKKGFRIVKKIEYCPKFISTLDDILVPFTLWSYFLKKIFNKWFIFKQGRLLTAKFLYIVLKPFCSNKINVKKGGIVFFHLKK